MNQTLNVFFLFTDGDEIIDREHTELGMFLLWVASIHTFAAHCTRAVIYIDFLEFQVVIGHSLLNNNNWTILSLLD